MKKKKQKYTEDFKNFVIDLVSNGTNITQAAKSACEKFGINYDDNVRRVSSFMLDSKGVTDCTEQNVEESDDFKKAKEREFDKTKNRFIITWCQNETDIHEQFLSNIESYAEAIDASIHVILGRYRNPSSLSTSKNIEKKEEDIETFWNKRVIQYADANRHNIHKHLCILSDIKVQPTASTPLSGLNGITGLESCILGHPRVHMKSLPILDGYPHKLLLTTGAVSLENYTDTKVGAKGAFHHTLGFVVVELDGDDFHVRQVTASDDGSFYDLDLFVDEEGVSYHSGADHVVFGDLHLGETNEEVLATSFNLAEKLNCKDVILHDVFNGHSISHHERNNPFVLMKREEDGSDNLFKELHNVLDFFNEYHDYNFTVVKSNHDVFLDRWLNDVDWRKSNNKMAYLKLANLLADSKNDKGVLDLYLEACGVENAFCLGINDSYTVGGIECGQHGHIGANGSRGGSNQFKELNTRIITGHSHSPIRIDGHSAVGTLTHLRVGYNSGASSWMNTNIAVYPNGKYQHINIINNKYTTL